MFAKARSGVFDFIAAALCLWAAAYHTPAGALIRSIAARAMHARDTARPLLAYYSSGVYDAREVPVPPPAAFAPTPMFVNVPPAEALGRGIFATVTRLGPGASKTANELAQKYGLPKCASAQEATALLARVKVDLSSDEAAVLAVFTGFDVAQFAVRRARGEGRPLTLESLVLQLPPLSANAIAATSQALMLGTAFTLRWPVAPQTAVSSPFGTRIHPITHLEQFHTGVDLAVASGTPVRVVADGIVTRASEDGFNGKVIFIDHGHGVMTAYCHNSRLLVAAGTRVNAGDVVSESGNTGRSTGPHLHYQLNMGATPADPFAFREKTTAMVTGGRD